MEHFRLNHLLGYCGVLASAQVANLLDHAHQALQLGIDAVALAGGVVMLILQLKKLRKPNEAS